MNNWVSTLCHEVWRQLKHPLQKGVDAKHDPGINGHVSAHDDPRPPPDPARHFTNPSSLDQTRNKETSSSGQRAYLRERENCEHDINKLIGILTMPQVLMEVGCGNAEAARRIALKNPSIGVIATDLYDWSHPQYNSCGYGQIACEWRAGQLAAQLNPLPNLVILRAETDLLRCFPIQAIDTIILINPEPLVGKAILALLQGESLSLRMKHGPRQIVILPYSRELGLMACGGCGFEHDPDWSRGLGFIMESGLRFERGAAIQWGVDLSRISAYTGNSTQRNIYIYGKEPI